ncbi:hypothetical protein O181_025401 [Austropuccinia psidii MF-1]|uniref:Uncharacterized protein n=1 Tax=Austropuccinia psidii MF-1 TaxID=1389203 RepID=A0A9Q3CIG3_9BASI|nr:hypothetical protein [Austropuccinia psidii MF-1]
MSSKLTELTESSPSITPPSVLCGYGILSQLGSPWSMASSGHFDPSQTCDGYKAVEVLEYSCIGFLIKGKECFQNLNPNSSKFHFCFVGKKPCHHPGILASNVRRYLWREKNGLFGKELPVSKAPTPDGTSGYSNCSDELDDEEAEAVLNSSGYHCSTSPSQTAAKKFQSQLAPSTPRNCQPVISTIPSTIPSHSPSTSTDRPAFLPTMRPSLIPQPRNSPMVTSQKLQPVASSSRRREHLCPFLFPCPQVLQQREQWPIRVTREDPNMENEGQESVARLFRRVDRNSGEMIEYANDRSIPSTASEVLAAKFSGLRMN